MFDPYRILYEKKLIYKTENIAPKSFCSVSDDSKEKAEIFVAIKGSKSDGHDFINKAILNGAKLIVCQRDIKTNVEKIVCKDTRKALAILSNEIFSHPTKKFKLIGVTGTNGKSSITYLIYQILKKMGKRAAFIGTGEYRILNKKYSSNLTTPNINKLNRIFTQMVKQSIDYVIMEVSSHAISQYRIFGLYFDVAILSNISQDHLDFHKTMEDYTKVKIDFILNVTKKGGLGLINIDNQIISNKIPEKPNIFSLSKKCGNYQIKNIKSGLEGNSFTIKLKKEVLRIVSKIPMSFNIYNLALSVACLDLLDLKPNQTIIQDLKLPLGRGEIVKNKLGLNIIVDYAHTPDAISEILKFHSTFKKGRLICVVGAGGERDIKKRLQIGKIATKYSDFTIFTKDNSRLENPETIFRHLTSELSWEGGFTIISDRFRAIETALSIAQKGDSVLVLGKGSEKYIFEGNKKYPFNDTEVVKSIKKPIFRFGFDPLFIELLFNSQLSCKIKWFDFICTDSRKLKPNSIFFCLSGANYDAHQFVSDVLMDKRNIALVEKDVKGETKRIIKVNNVLAAYQKLAKIYRTYFGCKVIAITGSVGKTTTKECCAQILTQKFTVLKTFKNYNNQIGVPKTLFHLSPKYQCAVMEAGTSKRGEIEILSKILKPEITIITNIHQAHTQFFGNIQNIFKEKIALFKDAKVKIFSKDNTLFSTVKGISVGFANSNDYIVKTNLLKKDGIQFTINDESYFSKEIIPYRLQAISFAIICAKQLGISKNEIDKSLKKRVEIDGRMQFERVKGILFLVDCYNANPVSMRCAIDFWKSYLPQKKHIAVLGDMLELGKEEKHYHLEVAKQIEGYKTYSVGKLSKYYNCSEHFSSIEYMQNITFPKGSVVLLKSSNAIGLKKLLNKFRR